jgi:SAM-dependent methyltransferase
MLEERMHTDVTELRDFYNRPLGLTVRRLVGKRVRGRWPSVKGEVVMGLGFAVPYLAAFRGEAAVVGALMPISQGVLAWPPAGHLLSLAVDETALPLSDASVDRLVMVHCLETTDNPRLLLREVWRVLKPEGHLLVVVPSRRGPWARLDTTPFGQGRPYSRAQMERLLTAALFTPSGWSSALLMPPLEWRLVLRYAGSLERAGGRFWPAFAGVVLVEARKELVSPIGRAEPAATVGQLRPFRAAPSASLSGNETGEAARRPGSQAGGEPL